MFKDQILHFFSEFFLLFLRILKITIFSDFFIIKNTNFQKFLKNSKCFRKKVKFDDCFLVKCTVKILKATKEETQKTCHQSIEPPSDLHLHLAKLLESREMAAGTRLLSQIEDMKAPVFKALLHYVYTDKLPAEEGDADHKALTCLTSLLCWYWYRQLQKS